MANLVYVLYLVGFFAGITALIGVVLAYVNRDRSSGIYRSHLNFQIKIFWRGVIFMVAGTVLFIVATMLAAVTMGIGAVLMVLPVALSI